MDSMKAAAGHSIANGTRAQAEGQELKEGNNAMLLGGDGDDQPVERTLTPAIVGFRRYSRRFSTIARHGAIVAAKNARVGGVCVESPPGR
jgi:hypothetical protein